MRKIAAIVLAAGKGTRLAGGAPSPKPKVLYELLGKPIISYVISLLKHVGLEEIVIVVGHKADEVKRVVGEGYKFVVQSKRLGTGHAVKIAMSEVTKGVKDVLVLNGDDSAFYRPETIKKVLDKHAKESNVLTFVTLKVKDPKGLGRVIRRDGEVVGIVEEKIASEEEKRINEINDGVYVFDRKWLEKNLVKIKKSTVGEYYLVDLIGLGIKKGEKVEAFLLSDPGEWCGVNDPQELEQADRLMRQRNAG